MATCTVTGTIYYSDGTPAELILVYAIPAMSPAVSSTGYAISPVPIQALTSSTGFFSLNLMIGVQFVVTIQAIGFREKIVIPNSLSYDLFNLTSVPFGDEVPPIDHPSENPNW